MIKFLHEIIHTCVLEHNLTRRKIRIITPACNIHYPILFYLNWK